MINLDIHKLSATYDEIQQKTNSALVSYLTFLSLCMNFDNNFSIR